MFGGFATGNIIAGKIENKIPDVHIMRILSSDKINEAFEHDCDLILSTIAFECDDIRFMQISPLVSFGDEKRIREKMFFPNDGAKRGIKCLFKHDRG